MDADGCRCLRGAFLLSLLLLTACAVAPAPAPVAPVTSGMACAVERGTPEGLILRIDVPEDLGADGLIILRREGATLGQVAISELPERPVTLRVGDADVVAGTEIAYECALVRFGHPEERLGFSARVPELPERPSAVQLEALDGAVRVAWTAEDDTLVQVLRRDLLEGDELAPVSPFLRRSDWEDDDVVAGHVYAYALRAARLSDGVVWEGEQGVERYVEPR